MSDGIALAIQPDVLARAIWQVSHLIMQSRVTVETHWEHSVVTLNVTGLPEPREEILAALGQPEPHDWTGETGQRYREWTGHMLTMHVLVTETLPPGGDPGTPVSPASDPAGGIVPSPSPVPSCVGAVEGFEGECGEPGPHGPHRLGDDPGPIAGGPGERRMRIVPVILPALPGKTPPAGMEYAAPDAWTDPDTAAIWRHYVTAVCMKDFDGQKCTTLAMALDAVDKWPGRRLLTRAQADNIALMMVEPPEVHPRSRLTPLVELFKRWGTPRSNPSTEEIAAILRGGTDHLPRKARA